MAPPLGLTWHQYLKGYGTLVWRAPDHERRYHELSGLTQPLYALLFGNLLDSTGPKIVIATPTPRPVVAKGHAPFTFKVQCLITGRMSRAIPYERLIEFGIFSEETKYPAGYQGDPLEIEDKISPLLADIHNEIAEVTPRWVGPGTPWHERYAEYLQSEEWLAIRAKVLKRDNYRCRITGKASRAGDPLQIHHLTYARVGCEDLEDLITVSRSAHRQVHGRAA